MIPNTDIKLKYRLGLGDFNFMIPATYLPTPNPNAYKLGFITRYFSTKRNQNQISEVNARDYANIDDGFFIKGTLLWRISGVRNNLYKGTMLVEPGVEEFNRIQIANLRQTMPGIEDVLINLLQFWQGY